MNHLCAACGHPGASVPSQAVPGRWLCDDTVACLRRGCPPRAKVRPRNGEARRDQRAGVGRGRGPLTA